MASASQNGETSNSTIFFHPSTFGQNIQIDAARLRAFRHTSFDNGVTFTDKQIKMNERIYMKIIDVDDSGQWLGSLAIGFIQNDPSTIQRNELCKSAIPNICQKTTVAYVKRIFEKLTRNTVIIFYYNQDGAFYILDGKEQEISRGINTRNPMWGVIDLYGNVKGASLVGAPSVDVDSKAFFIKYDQKPDKLPIKYFKQLDPQDIQKVGFCDIHGSEIDLYCQNTIAFRKHVRKLMRPYVFINFPMKPGDEILIRILSVDFNYRLPGVVGFTNAKLSDFSGNVNALPADDPTALYDRSEFWIVNEDAFDETVKELDEYRFTFKKDGSITLLRNNSLPAKSMACADPHQAFYPFFFLNGRIVAFSLVGLLSEVRIDAQRPVVVPDTDPDSDICQLCYDQKANCVISPCGHMFFCSKCAEPYVRSRGKMCPICREPYEQIFEIAEN